MLNRLSTKYPTSADVARVQARLSEVVGDQQRAVQMYQKAIACGSAQPAIVTRLARLLVEMDRLADADQVVTSFQATYQQALPSDLAVLVSSLAFQSDDERRAVQLARENVARYPQDVDAHLWIAELLSSTRKFDEAEMAYRNALQLAPGRGITWQGWVTFLVQVGRDADARAAVESARKSVSPSERSLTLAACYEIVGASSQTESEYLVALSLHPDDPATVRALAEFYICSSQRESAEMLLWRLLDPGSQATDRDREWASQQLEWSVPSRVSEGS